MYFLEKENKIYCKQILKKKCKDLKKFLKNDLDKNIIFYLYFQLRDHPKRYKKSSKKFKFVKKQILKLFNKYLDADEILSSLLWDYEYAIQYAVEKENFDAEKLKELENNYKRVKRAYNILDEEIKEFFIIVNEYDDETYKQYNQIEKHWLTEIK